MIDRIDYDDDFVELCVYKPTKNTEGLIGFDEWLIELYGNDPARGIRVEPLPLSEPSPPLKNNDIIEQIHDESYNDGKCL